jgi:hypothetical protein
MRPLSPRERTPLSCLSKRRGWQIGDGDSLCAEQSHPLASGLASAPVSPLDRMRGWRKRRGNGRFGRYSIQRPQHATSAAWFLGGGSISLTLFPQWTCTAMAHTSSIQNTHTAIAFRSPFLWIKGLPSRTAECAIRLGGECVSGKTDSSRAGRANFGGLLVGNDGYLTKPRWESGN